MRYKYGTEQIPYRGEERVAAVKTSVQLSDELHRRWKESGLSLTEVIRRGLEYGEAADSPVQYALDLREDVRAALDQMTQLIALLRDKGYLIMPRDDARALMEEMRRLDMQTGQPVNWASAMRNLSDGRVGALREEGDDGGA